jgi:hypothetical protein
VTLFTATLALVHSLAVDVIEQKGRPRGRQFEPISSALDDRQE